MAASSSSTASIDSISRYPYHGIVEDDAYTMCCREECEDRQKTAEISIFETTFDSLNQSIKQRRIDPSAAVSKYRRSAAGHTVHYPPRSLQALEATVDHLIRVLVTQTPPNSLSVSSRRAIILSWMNTVQFFEDRVRAAQVDLVKTQAASKQLQLRLARSHILILYLSGDCKAYAATFGQKALQTALSSYWNDTAASPSAAAKVVIRTAADDDEILSYMALQQCSQHLQQQERNTAAEESLTSSVLMLYRKYMPTNINTANSNNNMSIDKLPLFQWTLQLTARISLGHWRVVLKMLHDSSGALPAHFIILARCCLATGKNVTYLQWKALQVYNASFRKAEPVTCVEVARLLCLADRRCRETNSTETILVPAAQVALELGQAAGLPGDDAKESLIFKAGPIQELGGGGEGDGDDCSGSGIDSAKASTTGLRVLVRDDGFVFGTAANEWNVVTNDPTTAATTTWDDDSISATNKNDNASNNSSMNGKAPQARRDAEGVLIPPTNVMLEIILV